MYLFPTPVFGSHSTNTPPAHGPCPPRTHPTQVCAALLHKALGPERLICLHIDHGFMRDQESATVVAALRSLGVPLEALDATSTCASAALDPATSGFRIAASLPASTGLH